MRALTVPTGLASLARSPVLLLAAIALLVGCAPDPPPEIESGPSIAANPNEAAPQAAILSFEASEPVKSEVTVEAEGRSHTLTYPDTLDPSGGLPVVGLWPGVENRIRVTVEDRGMNRMTLEETLTYRPPPLPEDRTVFPPIRVTAADTARMEPGFTLFNARRLGFQGTSDQSFDQNFGLLVILDRSGEPVWYYRTDSRISDFNVLPNGHILYLTQDYRAVEIDLLGNEVASWYAAGRPQGEAEGTPVETITFHHDIEQLHTGNLLVLGSEQREIEDYYSSETDPDAPRSAQTVMGDRVLEFDPATGEIVWSWNAFAHMDPFRIGYDTFSPYWPRRGFPNTLDWSHANALVPRPGQDAVLVNFRLQSAITQIDRRTGRIEWIFGEHSGWPEELEDALLEPQGDMRWPYHQHAPMLTDRGTLLLFDNGNFQARPFEEPAAPNETRSRVVEYAIDREEGTVRQIWSSEEADVEPVVSFAMGVVEVLPETGNVLAGYGFVFPPEHMDEITWENFDQWPIWTMVREFTLTANPQLVWEVRIGRGEELPVGWTLFGVERLSSLDPFPERGR